MMHRLNLLLLTILASITKTTSSIKWLALNKYPKNEDWNKYRVCSKIYGLNKRQIKICRINFNWMPFLYESATLSQEECRNQFKARKWDCYSVMKAPKFNHDLKQDTREAAFVYALSAATLVHRVSLGCLEGRLEECSCLNTNPHKSFPAEMVNDKNLTNIDNELGCRQITKIGEAFARTFITSGFRRKLRTEYNKKQFAVRNHNTDVGIQEIRNGEEIFCTCNGATAGCTIKYCHRRITQLDKVAANLLNKYDKALKVNNENLHPVVIESYAKERKNPGHGYQIDSKAKNSLTYLDKSEDYCEETSNGFYKTSGRQCFVDSKGTDSCKKLCCGRGFKKTLVKVESKCNCKFVWCCRMDCQICKTVQEIFECL